MTRSLTALAVALLTGTMASALPARAQEGKAALTKVASFEHQVTGITVARDGRIFVNFPRWSEDAPVSVAELKDGKPVPFPDDQWNVWRNARAFAPSPMTGAGSGARTSPGAATITIPSPTT